MAMIRQDEYMICSNEKIGVVYAPNKGKLKITTPEHAGALEEYLGKYHNNTLLGEDRAKMERFFQEAFGAYDVLPVLKRKSLLERNHLQRLEILVANDCNLNCRYCYAHAGTYDREKQRMTCADAEKYLEALIPGRYRHVEKVLFFGGEPTLCPDTIESVCELFRTYVEKGIVEKAPLYLMVTNGTLIDTRLAEIIKRFDIRLTVSIDGPKSINDKLRVDRSGEGTFQRIKEGLANLGKLGVSPVMIEATYTSLHETMGFTKESIREYLQNEFSVKNVMVASCNSGGTEEGLSYLDDKIHIGNDGEVMYADKHHTYNCLRCRSISDTGCDVAFGSAALLPSGEIYPCHFFVYHEDYRIAEYRNRGFDFTNYENVLKKFKSIAKSEREDCKKCWAKPLCLSCSAQLLLETDETEMECRLRRESERQNILKCAMAMANCSWS